MRNKKAKRVRDFDRRLGQRFWKIGKPFWFGDERWLGRGLLALLVVLLLGRTEFTVHVRRRPGSARQCVSQAAPAAAAP